ncbi:hypothetical protein VTK26DRAFT_1157 [Humicola hyalothermophila]
MWVALLVAFSCMRTGVIIERLRGNKPGPNAPKLFTPFVATPFTDALDAPMNEKVVFYLDDNNILHDQYYNSTTNNEFVHGTLSSLNIQCAPYSSLAAVTIRGDVVNHVCVFYQTPDADAAVKMVSFAGWHRTWHCGEANLRSCQIHGFRASALKDGDNRRSWCLVAGCVCSTCVGFLDGSPFSFERRNTTHL